MEQRWDFDLDARVARWRRWQERTSSLSPRELDELEDHLRAYVDLELELNATLGPARAFRVACREIGPGPVLSKEFAKVGKARWRRVFITGWAMYAVSFLLPSAEMGFDAGYRFVWDLASRGLFYPQVLAFVVLPTLRCSRRFACSSAVGPRTDAARSGCSALQGLARWEPRFSSPAFSCSVLCSAAFGTGSPGLALATGPGPPHWSLWPRPSICAPANGHPPGPKHRPGSPVRGVPMNRPVSRELVAASSRPMVLSILAGGESYGYEILKQVKLLSDGKLEWYDGCSTPSCTGWSATGSSRDVGSSPRKGGGASTTG